MVVEELLVLSYSSRRVRRSTAGGWRRFFAVLTTIRGCAATDGGVANSGAANLRPEEVTQCQTARAGSNATSGVRDPGLRCGIPVADDAAWINLEEPAEKHVG